MVHESSVVESNILDSTPHLDDIEDIDTDNTSSSIEEVLEQVHRYVQCLMNLLPSIERSLCHIKKAEISHYGAALRTFQVSSPASIYIRNIRDRFALADSRLTERLGEANWQRYQRIRLLANLPENDREDVLKPIFKPVSEFRDSALGSSIPAQSSYAATVTSHSSLVSTSSDRESGTLRVPPTPKEVSERKPFQCNICGKRLTNIRNRVGWKYKLTYPLFCRLCADHFLMQASCL